ncbi:MAG: glycoside hydrolase family 65 protein [Fimbriimonadaceae bacterium]|nr:glycoside hydrolase family 65 protein [Fimbriimonadaceae bacterium]
MRLCEKLFVISTLLLVVGCSSKQPSSVVVDPSQPKQVVQEGDGWTLATSDATHTTPVLLSNGLIGIRLNRSMDSSGEKGRPLDAFRDDFYDLNGEEKLLPVDNPMMLDIRVEGEKLVAERGKNYHQSLDMKTGVLRSSWEQQVGGKLIKVTILTVIHPTERVIAQSLSVEASRDTKGEIAFWAPNIKSAEDSHTEAFDCGVSKARIVWKLSNGDLTSSWTTVPIGPRWSGSIDTDPALTFERVISFGRSERAVEMQEKLMMADIQPKVELFDPPQFDTFDTVKKAAADYFATQFWNTDIEIDGPVDDQQAVRSMLYYIRSGISPNAQIAPGPFGLANQTYNGHVFWDADVWMFPALALIDPERAKVIPDYRIRMAKAAEKNFREARSWAKNKPDEKELAKIDALQYPWESSVTGLEVSPTETKQQHHITATVLFGLDHAAALGLADEEAVKKIGQKAAKFYDWRSVWFRQRPGGPPVNSAIQRTIEDTISPDESFWGHDDLYTNCVAEWLMEKYAPKSEVANAYWFYRPRDHESFLNYTGDRLKGYKQAAGILAIYPLQDPQVEKQAAKMMDRFADKVIANGPAMSDSVNALVWARLGQTDKAYETWRKSWREFTNHPLMLFSEKRRKEETYFLTGAGGSLQTVLYGFLGFRIDLQKASSAAWSIQLKDGRWLSVTPNLPKGWKKVTLKNFTVLGKKYTLIATHDQVRVTSGDN